MSLDLHLGWDNLTESLPVERRSMVAEDDVSRHLLIAFATPDDTKGLQPGQNPELYRELPLPVGFSRYTTQQAIAGMRAEVVSGQGGLMFYAATKILEALELA